jgi:hypothetical protein
MRVKSAWLAGSRNCVKSKHNPYLLYLTSPNCISEYALSRVSHRIQSKMIFHVNPNLCTAWLGTVDRHIRLIFWTWELYPLTPNPSSLSTWPVGQRTVKRYSRVSILSFRIFSNCSEKQPSGRFCLELAIHSWIIAHLTPCFNPRSESKLFCFFQVGTWNLELQFELYLLIGYFCYMLSHNGNYYFAYFLLCVCLYAGISIP